MREMEMAAGSRDLCFNVVPSPGESLSSLVSRLGALLRERDAVPQLVFVFGDCAAHEEVIRLFRRQLGAVDWPILWSAGLSCHGQALAGIQVIATQGMPGDCERVVVGGRVVGSCFSDGDAKHCLLGGLGPISVGEAPEKQAGETFDALGTALAQAGFSFSDIARTWFYNRDILAWYKEFNQVRTALYAKQKFRIGSLPASTAVSGANPLGAALGLGAWAVRPVHGSECVREIGSPMQCPAPAYGSSFSRAVEIKTGGLRRILVSGTASILPGGETAHRDDIQAQVKLTMEVIESLLDAQGMGLAHTRRAVAYCKRPEYALAFETWVKNADFPSLPYAAVHCDICRDDLLFEVELDAVEKIR